MVYLVSCQGLPGKNIQHYTVDENVHFSPENMLREERRGVGEGGEKREKKRNERDIDWLLSVHAPTRDQT